MLEIGAGFLITIFLGSITWGAKLNTRVAVLEANHLSLVTLIESHMDDLKSRLKRIESNTNGASGKLREERTI